MNTYNEYKALFDGEPPLGFLEWVASVGRGENPNHRPKVTEQEILDILNVIHINYKSTGIGTFEEICGLETAARMIVELFDERISG